MAEAGTSAPSLWLRYNDDKSGDILTQDVCVPSEGLTKYTNYCCLKWNVGMNGEGYCGIQHHPDRPNYIFSLWEPKDTKVEIKEVSGDTGTKSQSFGSEGTGLKSLNFSVGWKPDVWYTLVTRRWGSGDHTYFGFWVKHHLTMKWTHIVSVDFPVGGVYYKTQSCSFLEDWKGTGDKERRVNYKNGFKRERNGKWLPFSKAVFSKVSEDRSQKFHGNYNTGVLDDTFYLHSGGESRPNNVAVNGCTLTREMPDKPCVLCTAICVYLSAVTREEVEWEVPAGSIPQFRYKVYVDGHEYKQEFNSDIRKCTFESPPGEVVLYIENIYGQAVRSEFNVNNPPSCDPQNRTRLEVYIPGTEQSWCTLH